MHSIERYGIVALLFLVVTVVAVLMWDGSQAQEQERPGGPALASAPAAPQRLEPGPARPPAEPGSTLTISAESRPGPLLQRSPDPASAPALEPAGGVPLAGEEPALDERALREERLEPAGEDPATRIEQAASSPIAKAEPSTSGANAPAARADARRYAVRPGDTLSEIAQRELGSARRWKELVAANPGLDPGRLRIGQELLLPGAAPEGAGGARSAGPQPEAAAREASAPTATWKVSRGESLWKIAERTLGDGGRWREIAALNPSIDPDRLRAGAVLKLPAGAGGQAGAEKAPVRTAEASSPRSTAAPLVASSPAPRADRSRGKVK
jgi:nucleoid-associated protein YgaU